MAVGADRLSPRHKEYYGALNDRGAMLDGASRILDRVSVAAAAAGNDLDSEATVASINET